MDISGSQDVETSANKMRLFVKCVLFMLPPIPYVFIIELIVRSQSEPVSDRSLYLILGIGIVLLIGLGFAIPYALLYRAKTPYAWLIAGNICNAMISIYDVLSFIQSTPIYKNGILVDYARVVQPMFGEPGGIQIMFCHFLVGYPCYIFTIYQIIYRRNYKPWMLTVWSFALYLMFQLLIRVLTSQGGGTNVTLMFVGLATMVVFFLSQLATLTDQELEKTGPISYTVYVARSLSKNIPDAFLLLAIFFYILGALAKLSVSIIDPELENNSKSTWLWECGLTFIFNAFRHSEPSLAVKHNAGYAIAQNWVRCIAVVVAMNFYILLHSESKWIGVLTKIMAAITIHIFATNLSMALSSMSIGNLGVGYWILNLYMLAIPLVVAARFWKTLQQKDDEYTK